MRETILTAGQVSSCAALSYVSILRAGTTRATTVGSVSPRSRALAASPAVLRCGRASPVRSLDAHLELERRRAAQHGEIDDVGGAQRLRAVLERLLGVEAPAVQRDHDVAALEAERGEHAVV